MKDKRITELKETLGYIRIMDQVFGGIGKKPHRNKSSEKRQRLQKKLEQEAEKEIKEKGK